MRKFAARAYFEILELLKATIWMAFWMLSAYHVTDFILTQMGAQGQPSALITSEVHWAWNLAWSMFLVGVMEETLFRYILQDQILDRIFRKKLWVSWLLATVAFGTAHFINPGDWIFNLPQVVGATFAGGYLGLKYKERGLLFVILVHGLYDFLIMFGYYWSIN